MEFLKKLLSETNINEKPNEKKDESICLNGENWKAHLPFSGKEITKHDISLNYKSFCSPCPEVKRKINPKSRQITFKKHHPHLLRNQVFRKIT